MIYALSDGHLVQRIPLDSVADREGSFLNDIVVDEARRVAYIADSGLRSAPDNQAGLIVADANRGAVRRVLNQHPALMPVAGLQVVSHGETVWPGNPIMLGINGIALSPDRGNPLLDGHHRYHGTDHRHRRAARSRDERTPARRGHPYRG